MVADEKSSWKAVTAISLASIVVLPPLETLSDVPEPLLARFVTSIGVLVPMPDHSEICPAMNVVPDPKVNAAVVIPPGLLA